MPNPQLVQRGKYFNKFNLGDNRYAVDISTRPLNYYDKNDKTWKEIVTTLIEDTDGTIYCDTLPFKFELTPDKSSYKIYPDKYDTTKYITIKIPNILRTGDIIIENDSIIYSNNKFTLVIRLTGTSIKFEINVEDPSIWSKIPKNLSIDFLIEGSNILQDGSFENLDMKLINRIIDGNGKIKKINWNHSNGKLNLSIDDTDLVYPIVIDPTVDLDPGSSGNDGYIYSNSYYYSTAHNTAAGLSDGNFILEIGQAHTSSYIVMRSYLKFDTSDIPTTALIQSAKLKLYGKNDYSDTDFTIRLQKWTGDTPLSASDFNNFDGTNYDDGNFSTSSYTTTGYNEIVISNYNLITKGGYTKICVRSNYDISSSAPAGNEYIFTRSYDAGSSYYPILHIEYLETEERTPGTVVDDLGAGTLFWLNVDNAKTDDGNYASAGNTKSAIYYSHYLKCTNFGFSIDSSATISGIEVQINHKANGTINDSIVRLVKNGSVVGDNKSFTTTWDSSEEWFVYGGSSDLWGTTWTASDINSSNFGVVISVKLGGYSTGYVDVVKIKVYYESPQESSESLTSELTVSLARPVDLKSEINALLKKRTEKEAFIDAILAHQASDEELINTILEATNNLISTNLNILLENILKSNLDLTSIIKQELYSEEFITSLTSRIKESDINLSLNLSEEEMISLGISTDVLAPSLNEKEVLINLITEGLKSRSFSLDSLLSLNIPADIIISSALESRFGITTYYSTIVEKLINKNNEFINSILESEISKRELIGTIISYMKSHNISLAGLLSNEYILNQVYNSLIKNEYSVNYTLDSILQKVGEGEVPMIVDAILEALSSNQLSFSSLILNYIGLPIVLDAIVEKKSKLKSKFNTSLESLVNIYTKFNTYLKKEISENISLSAFIGLLSSNQMYLDTLCKNLNIPSTYFINILTSKQSTSIEEISSLLSKLSVEKNILISTFLNLMSYNQLELTSIASRDLVDHIYLSSTIGSLGLSVENLLSSLISTSPTKTLKIGTDLTLAIPSITINLDVLLKSYYATLSLAMSPYIYTYKEIIDLIITLGVPFEFSNYIFYPYFIFDNLSIPYSIDNILSEPYVFSNDVSYPYTLSMSNSYV